MGYESIKEEMIMRPFQDLDSLGKKARIASGRIRCDKCPLCQRCNDLTFEACTYIFEHGYRAGYNRRKKEKSNE